MFFSTSPELIGTLKRLSVWAAILITQSFLMELLLLSIVRPGGHVTIRGIISFAFAELLYFCITGYALTTALTLIYWEDARIWTYPICGSILFLVHFEILNYLFGHGRMLGELYRNSFIVGGMCIAFVTTLLGTWTLKRWGATIGSKYLVEP